MRTDVVISGGGPVGLMLACELRLAGVDVLVLERRTEIDPTIKAGSITVPTAEAMYRRGLLPALAAVQRPAMEHLRKFRGMQAVRGGPGAPAAKPTGQFAGITIDGGLLDRTDPAFRDTGPAGELSVVAQQRIEQVLGERAAELGVDLRRGVELTGFDAGDDGVTVRFGEQTARAGWLVGCDGGRSLVRKQSGFDFPGTDATLTGRQALVDLDGAEKLRPGWTLGDNGLFVYWPMPGRIVTIEFDGPPADRDAAITAEEIEASLRRVSGTDVRVTKLKSATRYTDNTRQATTYRLGRVLLAGDAAHVHSPFGGQGLNLGLGDAVNLGWKLAATVRGDAPEGLLDSYTTERHPIGEWVLDWTRAQVALMRPDAATIALRGVVTDLLSTREGATYLAKQNFGLLLRYPIGGEHDLVGTSAPDFEFADGSRLGEHLQDGQALLLDLTESAIVRDLAKGPVRTLTTKCVSHSALTGVLVRPDGIIAWAREDGGTDGLDEALRTWFAR